MHPSAIELKPDKGPFPTIVEDILLKRDMSPTKGATKLEVGKTEDGIPFSSKAIIPFSSSNSKTNSWYFPSPPAGIARLILC